MASLLAFFLAFLGMYTVTLQFAAAVALRQRQPWDPPSASSPAVHPHFYHFINATNITVTNVTAAPSNTSWHPASHTSIRPGFNATSNHSAPTGPALVNSPLGSVEVFNLCPFDVQSNIVHGPRQGDKGKPEEVSGVLAAGGRMEHPYLHDPSLGVSWKFSRTEGGGPVQFEWTWAPDQKRVYWDLSMIDAFAADAKRDVSDDTQVIPGVHHSFAPHAISVSPFRGSNNAAFVEDGRCVSIRCPENTPVCREAYNWWDDYKAQRDCGEEVTLRIALCDEAR